MKRSLQGRCVGLSMVCCLALVCGLVAPAVAQQGPWPMPQVVLEVHPNERADGTAGGAAGTQFLGAAPWAKPVAGPVNSYWWQDYKFAASGVLWVQVCAQNWSKVQNGNTDDDNTYVFMNGIFPTDFDGIQSGAAAGWQWRGDMEKAQRVTLRFFVMGPPGAQLLRIGADETPVVWWVKVTDLEEHLIYPPL